MASGEKDPFHSLKVEVEAAIQEVASGHNWSSKEVEEALQKIQWDVDMVEDSLERIVANKDKFGISNEELINRRKYVQTWKKMMDDIRADISGGFGKANKSQGARENLLGSKQEQEGRSRLKKGLERENQEFIENEGMRQQLIQQEQDEFLDDIHESVTRLGEMGLTIHHELKAQDEIIEDLRDRTDRTYHNMTDINKQVSTMLRSKEGRNQLCLIVSLTIGLIVVTSLLFLLP